MQRGMDTLPYVRICIIFRRRRRSVEIVICRGHVVYTVCTHLRLRRVPIPKYNYSDHLRRQSGPLGAAACSSYHLEY